MAWALANNNVSVCLFGASKLKHIDDNVYAVNALGKMTQEVMEKLDKILANKPR